MDEHVKHEHEHGHECGSGHGHCECEEEDDMASQMLELADEAWGELLKEKIKKLLEKNQGAKLDKLAEICYEGAHEYYTGKFGEKAKWAEFEEKLNAAMME